MRSAVFVFVFLFSLCSWADVKIYENSFKLSDVQKDSSSFYARMYRWSSWAQTPESKSFDVSPDPIKQSYEAGRQVYELPEIDEDVLLETLEGDDGEKLADYYFDRDPAPSKASYCLLGEACNEPYPQVVLNTKVGVEVSGEVNLKEMSLGGFVSRFAQADHPHMHTKVSRDFARSFVYGAHLSHEQIQNHPNEEIYLSVLDFSWKNYQCSDLETAVNLRLRTKVIYTLNLFKELSADEITQNPTIEPGAVRVFEQKTVFSSELLRSSHNYLALYEVGGRQKLVLYGTVVAHDAIESVISPFLNGMTLFNLAKNSISSTIPFDHSGAAKLNSENLYLDQVSGECSKGLGPGVGRYIYGLAKKIAHD